jgi:putative DNA-invertase from lambdoid prophage Rac
MTRLSQLKYTLNRATLCHREVAKFAAFHDRCCERIQLGQTAALYCRVSTADQNCARQERDLRAFAKKAGYKIAGVWKETASGARDDRAERKEVLALGVDPTVVSPGAT